MRNPLLRPKIAEPLGIGRLDALAEVVWRELSPEDKNDRAAYLACKNKLDVLLQGITHLIPKTERKLHNSVWGAKTDLRAANDYVRSGDYGMATIWQHSALGQLRYVLTVLHRKKLAYGYDTSGEMGEIFDGSAPLANKENQNQRDENKPEEQEETAHNPTVLTRDYDAEQDFNFLREKKDYHVNWPSRTGKPSLRIPQSPYPGPK